MIYMTGKVLKIASNDLYGNVDDRIVNVFACFSHVKYMNNYVVFSIVGDPENLYYGSIHIKEKSIVIFEVKNDVTIYINEFITEFFNNNLLNFKILDINKMEKVEMVSYNKMPFDKLVLLENMTIPKVVINEDITPKEKKPIILYLMIFILIILGAGITLLYFKPELFAIKYRGLDCSAKILDEELAVYYDVEKSIIYDPDDKLESISVIKTYNFVDVSAYEDFKNLEDKSKYFNNGESYKYLDSEFKFRVFYQENSIIDDYDEMLSYLKREGFSCVEREYEK